jgi:hypothetical protein
METPEDVLNLFRKYENSAILCGNDLCDRYMSNQTRFAYVSIEALKTSLCVSKITPWFGCRGFLNEVWFGTLGRSSFFHDDIVYDIGNHIHGKPACLLVKDITETQLTYCTTLLNYLERKAGWEKTSYVKIQPKYSPLVFLLVGSKNWFRAPVYLSLWTFLVRTAHKEIPLPNDTLSTWLSRASKKGHVFRDTTISNIFKTYKNLVELLMSNIEFILKEDNFVLYRNRRDQTTAHDAGISSFAYSASTLSEGLECLEEDSQDYKDLVAFLQSNQGGYAARIHPHAVLRTASVLRKCGITKYQKGG